MVVDLLILCWLAAVTAAVLGVGTRWLMPAPDGDPVVRAIGGIASMTLLTIAAVMVLSRVHLLNWFTVLVVFAAAPAARWLRRHEWKPEPAVRHLVRRIAIDTARQLETGMLRYRLRKLVLRRIQAVHRRGGVSLVPDVAAMPAVLVVAVAAGSALTVYLRFAPVLNEPRLASPEAYAILLEARQALFNAYGAEGLSATAALSAALAMASSVDVGAVVRLLPPAVGVALVLAVVLFVRRATTNDGAALAAGWVLGACAFGAGPSPEMSLGARWILDRALARQWTANDGTLGLVFLVLGATCLLAVKQYRGARAAAAGCASVVALSSPVLLLLLAAAVSHTLPRAFRLLALGAISTALTAAAAYRAPTDLAFALPVALAVLVAGAWVALSAYAGQLGEWGGQRAGVAAVALVSLALLPQRAGAVYLEHEIAARQALEIARTFPRGKWLIVAPLEQLAETYGRGWFEDAAVFVAKYGTRAADPAFAFDAEVDDILVFVERRPFKTFPAEATDVPFPTLVDPTYRHYRSLAGRASLQMQLLALCEAYRRTHAGASVYYQDEQLVIYRFRMRD